MINKNASTFVISITCFDENERFDPEAQRRHFRRMAEAGIGVFVGGGGSGEGYTINPDEYDQLLQIAKEELKGKTPVRVMGVEPRSAQDMIDFAKKVEPFGLDALQIYSLDQGHGEAPNPREIERYFRDVFEAVKIPCVLSTHMSVGWYVPIPLLKQFAKDYPQMIGINATNPDVRFITELVDEVGKAVEIHVGGPMQGLTILAQGGTGFLTSEGNLVPKLCVSVIDAYKEGDTSSMMDRFAMLLRVFKYNTEHGSIRGVKSALGYLGLPGGYPRRPRLPVTPEQEAMIKEWVDRLNIKEIEGMV
jgi:4-hydroxy-tetrahydrodipicolinate synthase